MKLSQHQQIFAALQVNVDLFKETKGENALVGLEGFTEEMLVQFDKLWDHAAERLARAMGSEA